MGQGQSAVPQAARSHEQLVKELANRFAEKCYTSIELYSLKDNFRSLADREDDIRYLREDTVARFLEIPDILHASPVLFDMLSCLGAFPFLGDAPVVLGLEQLVIVVTLLTARYRRVLAHGSTDRRALLFRSLAVHDRALFAQDAKEGPDATQTPQTSPKSDEAGPRGNVVRGGSRGFAVDAPVDDDAAEDDTEAEAGGDYFDDNDLVLAAFEVLDYTNPLPTGSAGRDGSKPPSKTHHAARIPADNFRKLVLLLLLAAPLGPQEKLSQYVGQITGEGLNSLRAAAECVLATFLNVETSPGIQFQHFEAIVPVCFPNMFGGLEALMEHFLFSKNLDLSRPKPGRRVDTPDEPAGVSTSYTSFASTNTSGSASPRRRTSSTAVEPQPPLLMQDSDNTILNLSLLSQLSFFLPGSSLFHRLRLLYSGDNDGFSMGAFESRVFNWRAPTILLVRGTRVGSVPHGGQEAAFAASLPPRRYPVGSGRGRDGEKAGSDGVANESENEDDAPLVFGAYVSQPWRLTNRECFGDGDCVLFQLAPVHDVFAAATLNRDYVSFTKPTAANQHVGGIALGCPPPSGAAAQALHKQHSFSSFAPSSAVAQLGPLSLRIDAGLEFGVLTHDGSVGGAFRPSVARPFGFQERFAIEAVEVWGCGGDAEARAQAERWAWEAREAEARRRINLGTGDAEADRQLLEMAGLIGQNRSGGSMG